MSPPGRAAAAIRHPNVMAIYDVDEIGEASFIVMELVSGTPLRRFVGDGAVPLATVAVAVMESDVKNVAPSAGLVSHTDSTGLEAAP